VFLFKEQQGVEPDEDYEVKIESFETLFKASAVKLPPVKLVAKSKQQ
jgi:hypothetical protein